MEKAVMWRVLRLEPEANKSTAAAFDDLWENYGQKGYRRLSVRKGAAEELWALLFKGDQAKLTFEEPITTVCAIAKPGGGSGGQAGAKAIEKFARDWFVTGERTSNFRIAVAPESDEHAVKAAFTYKPAEGPCLQNGSTAEDRELVWPPDR